MTTGKRREWRGGGWGEERWEGALTPRKLIRGQLYRLAEMPASSVTSPHLPACLHHLRADPPCTSIIHDNTKITLQSRPSATAADRSPNYSSHASAQRQRGCTPSLLPWLCGVDTSGYLQSWFLFGNSALQVTESLMDYCLGSQCWQSCLCFVDMIDHRLWLSSEQKLDCLRQTGTLYSRLNGRLAW